MDKEVVLRRDVAHLGKAGDVVKVAMGHARNFLIPRGLAYPVTSDNLLRLESEKKKLAKEAQAHLDRMRGVAKELSGKSYTIPVKATEDGHLYGSVDAGDLAKLVSGDAPALEARSVLLEEPIKETGIYEVEVQLHADVSAKVKVWVVDEERPDEDPTKKPEPTDEDGEGDDGSDEG